MKRRVNFSFDVDDSELIDESFLHLLDDRVKSVTRNYIEDAIKDVVDQKIKAYMNSWYANTGIENSVTKAVKEIVFSDENKEAFKQAVKDKIPDVIDRFMNTRFVTETVTTAIQNYVGELVKKQLTKEGE